MSNEDHARLADIAIAVIAVLTAAMWQAGVFS